MPVASTGKSMAKKPLDHLFYSDGSLFHQNVKKVKKSIDMKEFGQLAKFAEKVEFVKKTGIIPAAKVNVVKPDIEEALKLKDMGNALFKERRLFEARDMYTKSLQYCPFRRDNIESNKEYAIILANRSACLDQGGMYDSALQDIDLALKCGYPKELKFKIYNRQGHSLFARKQFKDSREAFKKCSDFIGKSDMTTPEREKWRLKMAKQMSVFNSAKKGVFNNDLPARPWAQQAENESRLEIFETEKVVKATKDINNEEIVHTEVPFAAVILDNDAMGKICPHSMKRMAGGFPCTLGSIATFSTEEAKNEAMKTYHPNEYKTLQDWNDLDLSAYARLAMRLFNMIPKEKITDVAKNISVKKCTCEIEEILNLPVDQASQSDMLILSCVVNYMLDSLEKHEYFDDKVDKNSVIKLLLRALLVTARHSENIFLGNPPKNESDLWNANKFPTRDFALGIYTKFAQMKNVSNHTSGGADVVIFYQDSKIFVQSIRKLKQGKPVNIHVDINGKTEEMLNDMINFKCAGKECDLSFPLKEKTNEKIIKCPMDTCATETNIWKRLKRIVELKEDHKTARKEMEKKQIGSCIHFLIDLIDEWDTIIYRPYKEVTGLEEDLKKAILLNNETMEREWLNTVK